MANSVVTTPPGDSGTPDLATPIDTIMDELHRELIAYEADPASNEVRQRLNAVLRSLAHLAEGLSKRDTDNPMIPRLLHVVRQVAALGLHDYGIAADLRAQSVNSGPAEWPRLLAMMLTGSAWQWNAPALERVPQWLWAEYSAWLFTPPQGFTAIGDADRYAAYYLPRLDELARLVDRNTGSAAVRSAAEAYLHSASCIPLYFAQDPLRRHAELRGRVLKKLLGREATAYDPMPFPRTGRRLKIGFLNRHFGPQTETYTTLPTFEHLDPERFEVILYSLRPGDTELAGYCRSKAQDFCVLPSDIEGQLATLRDANLDVLVFGTNVTAVVHEVTRLALHRIAPLQVLNNSSCVTSGLPEIDLYVSGDLTEAPGAQDQFSERLALLPGPAHAFNYDADKQAPSTTWTRELLGIPADAVVFVSAANYFKIIPEMQHAWARLLASVPNSWLLVHPFNPNWSSSYPIKRFCGEFDRVLAEHGVGTDRLLISTEKFPSRTDVRELLSVGDVYLDTFPFGGVNSLIDPLEAGMPVITWEGGTFRSRMGAALLRSLGMSELIAADEQSYLRIASGLAADAAARGEWSQRIRTAMERTPVFMDTLAASDAFGDLMEAAFDEVVASGLASFRRQREPFSANTAGSSDQISFDELALARSELRKAPADARARHNYGNALLMVGNAGRASAYLLAAVQSEEMNPVLWYDLARAFRANGQPQEALQALEASLKLDVKSAASWNLVVELAEAVGAYDMVAEAQSVLQHLADNPPTAAVSAAV